ncbi:MAG: AMP-binding protein, partial [Betaproteobacteria bacterium]|nr:AMP-binding protein [Betaproteobacteria bacterium]
MPFNLGDLVDRTQDLDAPALLDCLDWERPAHYSHRDLDRLACSVADGLMRRGYRASQRIGILSANRAEFLAAYFGIMRAGLAAVPINHKFPRATIEFVLRDSDVRLVFCDAARRGLLPDGMPSVELDTEWRDFLGAPEFETVRPAPDAAAMILYTSGSTGRPKGVPLHHAGQLWAVRTRLAGGPYRDHRLLVAAPLFHMNALGTSKFVFAAHASMVLLPQFDARRYVEAIGRFQVTWITSVPTMMALAVREQETLAKTDVRSVRTVRMGSAPVTQKLIDDIRHLFSGATVTNAYGTTEAGPVMFGPSRDGRKKPDLALGWPFPEVEVRLVDAQGHDCDQGVLWIRTPANMKGYINLPEKTREVLTPEGWYISGDVFRRDAQGAYYFVGRTDDMFVCGGENIYPGEVEHMLEAHPDIVQACVVPVPDEIKFEKPFAFVVLRAGATLTEDDVKRYALEHAPAYQHPRQVVFMPALPLAGTNKVDRKALSEIAVAR